MTRQLRRKSSVRGRLRGIVARCASKAIASIDVAIEPGGAEENNESRPGEPGATRRRQDSAVHDARRQLRQARAGLRLLRSSLGKARYRRENHALRDAARPLTLPRDAKVLRATLREFTQRDAAESESARTDARLLADLERHLDDRLARLRAELNEGASHVASNGNEPLAVRLAGARNAIDRFRQRTRHWRLKGHAWPSVSAGVERVYCSGREAFSRAKKEPTVARLHECRKQAKFLRYELEMLKPAWPKRGGKLARLADRLGDILGENHDLALFADVVCEHFFTSPDAELLLAKLDQRRDSLTCRAIAIGNRLYRRKPAAFVERLRNPWHAWRDG